MSDKRVIAISAIVLVAVVMGMSFGIVQAMGPGVTEHVGAVLKIQQNGNNVDVEVKAQGLEPNADFQVRAYTSATDCGGQPAELIGTEESDSKGNLAISGGTTAGTGGSPINVGDVKSVSIRDTPALGNIVVCFQNTTP